MFLQLVPTIKCLSIFTRFGLRYNKITRQFPKRCKICDGATNLGAALSVHLNIAEGCFLKSEAQRKLFF